LLCKYEAKIRAWPEQGVQEVSSPKRKAICEERKT
jgi:hypothetical protein